MCNHSIKHSSLRVLAVAGLAIILISFAGISRVSADNVVDVRLSGTYFDTIHIDMATSFDFYIENDIVLGGLALGFRIWSPDGVTWTWDRQCISGMNPAFVCVVPGSRADGPMVWDAYPILLENDVDGMSPDSFMFGGMAMTGGLQPGPLEHMYSAHFTASSPDLGTLCLDSCFIPPGGAFVFLDMGGSAFSPVLALPPGGICYPVGTPHFCHPDWYYGNPTSMIIDHCGTGMVHLEASEPEELGVEYQINSVVGGGGTATVSLNGDVAYTPVPEDVNQSIQILVDARCGDSPFGMIAPWELDVTVTNDPPALDSGFYYNWGAGNNLLIKDDIVGTDNDACDDLVFSIVSGPGEIDPETGVYSWMPFQADTGAYVVSIELTDGIETVQGSFHVGITDETCCAGDVNYTGDVNVGDAVSLINYIFKGGNEPIIMNWADPNADCLVNVGDVVYLIAYIFRGGPPPQVGCYYSR